MKNILLALGIATAFLNTQRSNAAEGWPADYSGVMLQGFYWDSYGETKWTKLESQAETLAEYFDLIWVPQSGYCNSLTNQMGYSDIWWFDQKSCFGTAEELKSMIQTFKSKGLFTIADVVINHKNGNTSWCDFPTETWNGHTMTWSLADICQDDECNNNLSKWSADGQKTTGAKDTGSNFDGCRDLDHTSPNVQQNIKLYLQFLQEEMGYAGFRYDMTGGYAPAYTKIYNEAANPTYSVGEYWMSDGLSGLQKWIDGTDKTSAAFDFQLKWLINNSFNNNSWSQLANYTSQSLIGSGYDRYAVTFADNHDTGRSDQNGGANMLKGNIEAANAYILTMPGTPCVWLTHWMGYKTAIKKQILARKLAGITNQSKVVESKGEANGYSVGVQGKNGKLLLCLGTTTTSIDGYQLAVAGTNYKLYVSDNIDITEIQNIEQESTPVPDNVAYIEGKFFAYFEKPANGWNDVSVWAWNDNSTGEAYLGTAWPGVSATKVGTADNGNEIWLWTTDNTAAPDFIIFNNDNHGQQTANLDFINGGYYTSTGLQYVVSATTDVQKVQTRNTSTDNHYFNINGQQVSPKHQGIYIHDGRKFRK